MVTLPPELWLVILEKVVEGNVVGLGKSDCITFPFIEESLYHGQDRYRLNDSHRRLRLVCRSFNAIVGPTPTCYFSPSSLLPFPSTIRVLIFDVKAMAGAHFRRLLTETSTCDRLACLNVTCTIAESSDRLNLFDFICACEGGAFHNVQRLTLRIFNNPFWQHEFSFWTRLNHTFPLLVTLVMMLEYPDYGGSLFLTRLTHEDVTFERLEILYLGGLIPYWGFNLPRLRHVSIETCSELGLEKLTRSPHLESLLIRDPRFQMSLDVGPFSHLRVLGVSEGQLARGDVVSLDRDHPLEHFWLFASVTPKGRGPFWPFSGILEILPGVSRITVDLSWTGVARRRQRTEEFQRMKLANIGLSMRPPTYGDRTLIIERLTTVAKDGILKKVWGKVLR
jgi:hypothetical protein